MNAKRLISIAVLLVAWLPGCALAEASSSAPPRLRDTGFYAAGPSGELAPGVAAFSPQYPLWSDGAGKRRWIALPPGTFIDASRPDAWEFPRGTRLWKEFSAGGRVETRFIERLGDGSWRFATYVWNEAGTEALLAPRQGATIKAGGRRYSIPSESDCRACHEGAAAPVLGFSALQLSPDRDPLAPHAEPAGSLDLVTLVSRGWLRNLPQRLLDKPPRIAAATPVERAALGYLHGNCGHCHGKPDEAGASVPVGVLLAHDVADPDSSAAVMRSLVGASSRFRIAESRHAAHVVAPGASRSSVLALRMRSRDPRVQMPPLGSDIPDSQALALIERWIDHSMKPMKE